MKKAFLLLLSCLVLYCSVAAAEVPDGYPEIRIDPKTGKPYDLGGRTVYIMDYWSGSGKRDPEPSEALQAQYDYQDWLMETYNCTIVQKQGGDWNTCAQEMILFTTAPDDSLRVYIIESGKTASLAINGIAADWSRSTTVNLMDPHWNPATADLMTIGSSTYGVSVGKAEPHGCLFFNKRLLDEAGIDWNDIYDMQASGTWTWAAWEKLLEKTTRDIDNDDVMDFWGVCGNSDLLYLHSVFSNGGTFFDFDSSGKLQPTMDSDEALEALNWGRHIESTYWKPTPDGANWDWYKESWKYGNFAFYVSETYCGFNDNSEMADMEDEWGCVAFPVPNEGDPYVTVVYENAAMIPSIYTVDEVSLISLIYELWTQPTPGIDNEYAWIGNKYNYTDDRAVDETYAMLREPEHNRVNKVIYLGNQNDVLGNSLLWQLPGSAPATLIDRAMPAWQAACDEFNDISSGPSVQPDPVQPAVNIEGMKVINVPKSTVTIDAEAFANTGSQVILLPDGCVSIGKRAFYSASSLKYVIVPASVKSIATNAFDGMPSSAKVLTQQGSNAAKFCKKYDIPYIVVSDEAMENYTSKTW